MVKVRRTRRTRRNRKDQRRHYRSSTSRTRRRTRNHRNLSRRLIRSRRRSGLRRRSRRDRWVSRRRKYSTKRRSSSRINPMKGGARRVGMARSALEAVMPWSLRVATGPLSAAARAAQAARAARAARAATAVTHMETHSLLPAVPPESVPTSVLHDPRASGLVSGLAPGLKQYPVHLEHTRNDTLVALFDETEINDKKLFESKGYVEEYIEDGHTLKAADVYDYISKNVPGIAFNTFVTDYCVKQYNVIRNDEGEIDETMLVVSEGGYKVLLDMAKRIPEIAEATAEGGERRIDPNDGEKNTFDEFEDKYGEDAVEMWDNPVDLGILDTILDREIFPADISEPLPPLSEFKEGVDLSGIDSDILCEPYLQEEYQALLVNNEGITIDESSPNKIIQTLSDGTTIEKYRPPGIGHDDKGVAFDKKPTPGPELANHYLTLLKEVLGLFEYLTELKELNEVLQSPSIKDTIENNTKLLSSIIYRKLYSIIKLFPVIDQDQDKREIYETDILFDALTEIEKVWIPEFGDKWFFIEGKGQHGQGYQSGGGGGVLDRLIRCIIKLTEDPIMIESPRIRGGPPRKGRVQGPRRFKKIIRIDRGIITQIEEEEEDLKQRELEWEKKIQPKKIQEKRINITRILSYTNSAPKEKYTFSGDPAILRKVYPVGDSDPETLTSENENTTFKVTRTRRELGKGSFGTVREYNVTTTTTGSYQGHQGDMESFQLAGKQHKDKYEDEAAGYFVKSDKKYKATIQGILNRPDHNLNETDLQALNDPASNLHKYVARTTIVVNRPHLNSRYGLVLSDLMTLGSLKDHMIKRPLFYTTEKIIKVSKIIRGAIYSLIDGGYGHFDTKAQNIGVKATGNNYEPCRWILIDAGSMGVICHCSLVFLLAAFRISKRDYRCYLTADPVTVDRTKKSIDSTIIEKIKQDKLIGVYDKDSTVKSDMKFKGEYKRVLLDIANTPEDEDENIRRKKMLRLIAYCQDAILRAQMLGLAIYSRSPLNEFLLSDIRHYDNKYVRNMLRRGLDKPELVEQYNALVDNTFRLAGQDAYILQGLYIFE